MKFEIRKIQERLDSIEELVKLSLAANLLDDMQSIASEKGNYEKLLCEEISVSLKEKEVFEIGHYKFFDKMVVELRSEKKITVREMQELNKWLIQQLENTIPVFCFEGLNGMKRKRMLEEKISFKISDKEIHIVSV